MRFFGFGKKPPEKDETVFCSGCRRLVKLRNLRVEKVIERTSVIGDCPGCGTAYIKPHLPVDKYR